MTRFSSFRGAAAMFALAGALLGSSAALAADLSRDDYVDACEDGGFGADQSEAACICSYDYLTSEGSELLREATFILVDEGQEAQAGYLEAETGGDQSRLMELAGESEAMMDGCDFAEE